MKGEESGSSALFSFLTQFCSCIVCLALDVLKEFWLLRLNETRCCWCAPSWRFWLILTELPVRSGGTAGWLILSVKGVSLMFHKARVSLLGKSQKLHSNHLHEQQNQKRKTNPDQHLQWQSDHSANACTAVILIWNSLPTLQDPCLYKTEPSSNQHLPHHSTPKPTIVAGPSLC